ADPSSRQAGREACGGGPTGPGQARRSEARAGRQSRDPGRARRDRRPHNEGGDPRAPAQGTPRGLRRPRGGGGARPRRGGGVVRAALVEAEDGTVHEIAVGEFTLGRSSAFNVVANENAVSKVHARIERSADQLLLEDLSSSNGTFVNGTRVRTAVLRDTDTLE